MTNYSYSNTLGTGDRTGTITVTASGGSSGTISHLVNGNLTENNFFMSGAFSLTFDLGSAKIIKQARFYTSGNTTHGLFKWQGSNDNSSFTDIGSAFTLGGTRNASNYTILHTLIDNVTAYRYYKLTPTTGSWSSSPWINEFEFYIEGTTASQPDTSYLYPAGGVLDTAFPGGQSKPNDTSGTDRNGTYIILTSKYTTPDSIDPHNLLDGGSGNNGTDSISFASDSVAKSFIFDFAPTGRKHVVDRITWLQNTSTSQGNWDFAGSDDAVTWTDISLNFSLVNGISFNETTFTNTTAYRFYRLMLTSGQSTSNSPWCKEIFFCCAPGQKSGDDISSYSPSYSNGGGTGDRTSGGNAITITTDATAGDANTISKVIDGATTNAYFFAASQSGKYIKFDFGSGTKKIVNEIRWKQSATTDQHTWQVSYSDNDSTYTDIGPASKIGLFYNASTCLIGVPGNVGHRYWKMTNSGGMSSTPFIQEIEFNLVADPAGQSGTWGSTEAKDTFAGSGGLLSGTWGSTEAKDTFAGAGYPQLKGTLGATETKDTFAGTGTAPNPAPVFVNAGTRTGTSFASSITPTLPASLVNGNFLLAIVVLGIDRTPISTPTGWTVFNAFNNNLIGTVYYRFVDGTETNPTFNFGGGSTSATAKIWQFKNVITLGANNITPDAGNLNTFSNTGLTTTSHNALVVCLWYGNNGTVTGTPTGYTSRSNESNLALFDQTFAPLGSASTAIVNHSLSGLMNSMSFEIELCSELPPAFATMGPTEAKDVWASYGSLIGGSWRSTELRDLFSAAGYPQMIGSWGSIEAKDIFAGTGTIPPFGPWGSIEAKDIFAGTGSAAAPLSVDVHATGSSHDSDSASVSLTTTHADEVIVLAIYSGGHWDRAKVGSITDTAGLTWKKRNQRWSQGDNPSMEIWWAAKATSGATTITVHTLSEAGDPVGATQTGNKTGFLCVDAIAIAGANTEKPWDTHTGAGWFTDNFGNMRFGAPGDNGTVAHYYSNATKGMALAFYNTIGRRSTGVATAGTGWTWLERVAATEVNGNTGTLESAYKILDGRLLGDFFQLTEDIGALGGHGIMQDVIVAAADPNVATVSTNDLIRFFFDGPGQQTIVQLSGSNKSQSLALSTFNPDTVIVVAVLVQSAFGARVDHVADDGGGSGWTRRGIEVGVPGSLSLETWWCHHATPFTGNITVTLDSTAQAGDILGFVAVGIHGADVFQRGEIWDGHESLPKVNKDAGMASYQTTGDFSSLNADVLEINFAANTGSGFSDGGLQNFNEDPWLQFHGDFFGSLTGLLHSSGPTFNIAVQFKFSGGVVINDHTELNVTPSPTKWLMITDVMPVGPAIPPTGAWGSVEAKDRFTHTGDFTAIGIASPGGWVGFPPNSGVLDATDQKDRATNNGAYTAIWDTNGWIGYVPASMTLAFTENKDAWVSHAWVLGPTTILARWESVERTDGFGFTSAYTWYTTPDSKGDRTSRITVTSNALVGGSSGPFDRLVNGLRANNAASAIWVTPSQIAPMYFRFDFGTPRVVNEALWFQNGPSAQPGLWKWQGSNNSTSWTDLSATFVFNGGNSGSPVLGDFSSNQTPYRFYQVIQTTLAGGNDLPWLWEIEFKVGGFSGSMGAAESKDRMNYQMQLIPKVDPIPARKHRLLIVS